MILMNRVDEEYKMKNKTHHKISLPIALLVSTIPAITYAYNNTNMNQSEMVPPPGPYRSVMNHMSQPQMPKWVVQQQKNMMLHQQKMPMQHSMSEMPEWIKKQQQQHNKNMQEMFEKRKAEFEKHQAQQQKQMQAAQQFSSSQQPDWVKERREAYQKRFNEMQKRRQQNMPKDYVEWEKNRQAEIKKRTEIFKKQQAEAKQRADEFRKQFNADNKTTAAQQNPPEWYVKQQQQAQKQMEFYRAQQQTWMAEQAQRNQQRWTAQRQVSPYGMAVRPNMPAQHRAMPMPPRYQQMNPNMPPWAYPQYQPAPRR